MATVLHGSAQTANELAPRKIITDNQRAAFIEKNGKKTFYWYLLTVLLQALLFLPLPLILIYLYHAPAIVLLATAGLFLLTLVRTFLVQICAR